jgi:hypothetical protein
MSQHLGLSKGLLVLMKTFGQAGSGDEASIGLVGNTFTHISFPWLQKCHHSYLKPFNTFLVQKRIVRYPLYGWPGGQECMFTGGDS